MQQKDHGLTAREPEVTRTVNPQASEVSRLNGVEVGRLGGVAGHSRSPNGPPPRLIAETSTEGVGSADFELPQAALARPAVPAYNRVLFAELCRSTDTLVAMLVVSAVFLVANADAMPRGLDDFLMLRVSPGNLLKLIAFAFLWKTIFVLFGLYDSHEPRDFRSDIPRVVAACALGSLVGVLFVLVDQRGAFTFGVAVLSWPFTALATVGTRYGVRKVAERAARSRPKRVLIVGSGPLAARVHDELTDGSSTSTDVLGFVDTNANVPSAALRERMLGTLDDLEQILMQTVVDEVLIALPIKSRYAEIQRVIEECERAGVQSRYSADVFPVRLARPHLDPTDGQPAVSMKVVNDDYRLVVKRLVDVVGAAVGLVLLSPLILVIAAAVKLTSPGPVFFAQERYGWRKRRFKMYKFRTMVTNAEALQPSLESRNEVAGPVFKIANDPRQTRIGAFLRRSSLDELPQLWNVLRGDMSLVGPRPLPVRDVARFSDAWLMRRFSVVPGLTGLWQVSGRSNLGFEQWVQLDLRYIDQWSLVLDFDILVRTLPAVLRGTGAK